MGCCLVCWGRERIAPAPIVAAAAIGQRSGGRGDAQAQLAHHRVAHQELLRLAGHRDGQLVDEAAAPGRGFLSDSCVAWERALSRFSELGIRIVILRVGFVLSRQGGALPVMRKPVDWLLGAPLGSGKQYISWIDLDDLVGMFRFAMDHHQLRGTYNAVAPAPVTNRQLVSTIGKVLHRPVWPIPVPGFLLQLVLGEKAVLVTGGQRVSADKIQRAGYHFHFPALEASLRHQLL